MVMSLVRSRRLRREPYEVAVARCILDELAGEGALDVFSDFGANHHLKWLGCKASLPNTQSFLV
jgi:hypothetical protein